MAITLSNLSAAMGNGSIVKKSVVVLSLDIANDSGNAVNLTVEITPDSGSTWFPCTMDSNGSGQGVSTGSGKQVLVDVNMTHINNPLFARFSGTAALRVKAVDNADSNTFTGFVATNTFTFKSTLPTITAMTMDQYVGATTASNAQITITKSGDATLFRSALSQSLLSDTSTVSYQAFINGKASINFPSNEADGSKVVFVQVYDQYYNGSEFATTVTYLQRTPPTRCAVQIIGSTGNSDYTGIKINEDGSFTTDRTVTLQLSATSPIPMKYVILSGSGTNVENDVNTNTQITYAPENLITTVKLTTNPSNPSIDQYDTDASVTVNVRFIDAAGNFTIQPASIRLNTRIYKTGNKPLREEDSGYTPILYEVTSGGAEMIIPRTTLLSDQPIRKWFDIFFPSTHSYPVTATGDLDKTAAIAMHQTATLLNDAVKLDSSNNIITDDDGRPVMAVWTKDGSKNYNNMASSTPSTLQYWVIDNEGYGDFQLEFDRFDMDNNSYGPPFNPQSPYKGDCLVIYDATAPGALTYTIDTAGNKKWILNDATKLTEIMAFKGSGTNVYNIRTNTNMNAGQNGEFTTDYIRGVPRIVLIFYSDAAKTGSGFRIKAGRSHDRAYTNWDIDRKTGYLWIHKHSSLGNTLGAASSTTKRMVYQYLDQNVTYDFETGDVIFTVLPSGQVTADYSYLNYTGTPPSNKFIASRDDFLYYQETPAYVLPAGSSVSSSAVKNAVYEINGYGRTTAHSRWDKDRGILEFDTGFVPSGVRIFSDYYHHTYLRLSSDGFGDLTFKDGVLVADTTPVYPDYTFADVKLVNEGDALLEQGQIKFVARGYDTNNDGEVVLTGSGVVDQVLDINRPWDIQRGTKAETYEKMAMEIRANYTWDRSCLKSDAQGILSTWSNKTFGNLAARGRVFGRAVWVLGGAGGTSYPATSSGSKRASLEISGKYYASLFV